METQHPARRRFRSQITLPDHQINLAEAAFCIGWEDRGIGNPEAGLQQLDEIATRIAPHVAQQHHPPTIIQMLNAYFFDDLGFRGNNWSYGDPENSFLDHVLHTRAGLPITLSVVYLEIAWRLQLPLVGCALPGHFIVRYVTNDEQIFIDPFHRGRRWSYAECETQVRLFYGNASPEVMAATLEPPTRRSVLARMLRNLKGAYVERGAYEQAFAAIERVLMVDQQAPQDIRDRGLLHGRLGRVHLAIDDLDTYARRAPQANDLDAIRHHVNQLVARFDHSS
jgi:regulator of sirC expression with transglutaminase-like and TPR domain